MKTNRYSHMTYIFYGAISLALGYALAFKFNGELGDKTQLSQSSGKVRYINKESAGKYSDVLRFGLSNQHLDFQYVSKAGNREVVYSSLKNAGDSTVTVLYEDDGGFSPLWDDKAYHTVYAVKIGEKDVRSFTEVQKSWNSDNEIGFWAGLIFFVIGLIFVLYAFSSALSPNKRL